jgi:GT2 family glycosyltransferase
MTMPDVAAVAIGRNEGARLLRCLASLEGRAGRIVYVDSGSSDGSEAAAGSIGADVVPLDTSVAFTAARARNAGFDRLREGRRPDFVQFVDGDCEVQDGWIETAAEFLAANADVAVVCGRRRERFPEATLWNDLIDREWDAPAGEVKACGGDAMMRVDAFDSVGGFNPALIAGEEPELCVRLRQAGWRIVRLDAEMTLHDAEMTRVSQWWRRSLRAGHAYAHGAALHGAAPERHKVAETRRALAWGLGVPLAATLGALAVSPFALALWLLWPLQALRLVRRGHPPHQAAFLVLGKVPEAAGILKYWTGRLLRRDARLIEYK